MSDARLHPRLMGSGYNAVTFNHRQHRDARTHDVGTSRFCAHLGLRDRWRADHLPEYAAFSIKAISSADWISVAIHQRGIDHRCLGQFRGQNQTRSAE